MDGTKIAASVTLDPLSGKPLYRQLSEGLAQLVSDGTLHPGDPLPTEETLCDALGVSRTTARKAYAELVDAGRVVRRPRRGSFVAEPKLPRSLDTVHNFSEEMLKLGMNPTSKVLGFSVTKPSAWVADRLGVGPQTDVFEICRLRLADGGPILLETAWVPCHFCPNLKEEQLTRSLYALITEATGRVAQDAHETYEAARLSRVDARQLGCAEGDPAFIIRRSTSDSGGETFECSRIVAPGDRNQYEVSLHRDGSTHAGIVPTRQG